MIKLPKVLTSQDVLKRWVCYRLNTNDTDLGLFHKGDVDIESGQIDEVSIDFFGDDYCDSCDRPLDPKFEVFVVFNEPTPLTWFNQNPFPRIAINACYNYLDLVNYLLEYMAAELTCP